MHSHEGANLNVLDCHSAVKSYCGPPLSRTAGNPHTFRRAGGRSECTGGGTSAGGAPGGTAAVSRRGRCCERRRHSCRRCSVATAGAGMALSADKVCTRAVDCVVPALAARVVPWKAVLGPVLTVANTTRQDTAAQRPHSSPYVARACHAQAFGLRSFVCAYTDAIVHQT